VGRGLDDPPERAVCVVVVDAARVVLALPFQHTEADESAEVLARRSLHDVAQSSRTAHLRSLLTYDFLIKDTSAQTNRAPGCGPICQYGQVIDLLLCTWCGCPVRQAACQCEIVTPWA
jgi:hypothetical protein